VSDEEIRDAFESAYEPPSPEFRARLRISILRGRRDARGPLWGLATAIVVAGVLVGTMLAAPRLGARISSAILPAAPSSPTLPPLTSTEPSLTQTGTLVVQSVQLLSPSLGWAVLGDPGQPYQTLYRTTDGGAHWAPSLQGQFGDLSETMSFADDLHGVVLGDHLYRTADGGVTWMVAGLLPWGPPAGPVGSGSRLTGAHISFVNWWEGWILVTGSPATQCQSNGGALYHTVDGGQRWVLEAQAGPNPGLSTDHGLSFNTCLTGVFFHDHEHGWITSHRTLGVQRIFWTDDGGATWHESQLAACPGQVSFDVNPDPLAPEMWDSRRGILPATLGGALCVYSTVDAGHSWSSPVLVGPTVIGTIAPILFVRDSSHWWLASAGRLDRTVDGGRTWGALPNGLPAGMVYAGIDFVSAYDGWAVATTQDGSNGVLLKTHDGGRTWVQLTPR
jgi:photosystem II stability/assembly factor-like uncharacterized protein